MPPLRPRISLRGSPKKSQKNEIKIKNFSKIVFLSTSKALIHSIWTSDEKVKDNLVF